VAGKKQETGFRDQVKGLRLQEVRAGGKGVYPLADGQLHFFPAWICKKLTLVFLKA